jgi:hypothetical protein
VYPDVYTDKVMRQDQKWLFLGTIILQNTNKYQHKLDHDFIIKNYHDLLIIK